MLSEHLGHLLIYLHLIFSYVQVLQGGVGLGILKHLHTVHSQAGVVDDHPNLVYSTHKVYYLSCHHIVTLAVLLTCLVIS
jgi:hypothetical protein